MQGKQDNKIDNDLFDELDIKELFKIFVQGRWVIASITTFVALAGVVYSLLLPNIYESKALLVPVNPSSGISAALGSYAGLASLGGINLPPSLDEGNSAKAIEKISSLSFFENNILSNISLPDLMAVSSWNSKSNAMIYNENIYNSLSNTWIREYSHPQKQIPSAQESFAVFINEHLSLTEDKSSGFITLSIKHQSPHIAKEWTELIIKEINSFYRQKDKSQSEKAVNYLNGKILMTDLSEIKEVIAQILQEETKKLTLIEANDFYVFDYIDPPALMELKSQPNRAFIAIVSSFLGLVMSILIVLIRHYILGKKIF